MISIDIYSRTPVYQQIIDEMKKEIVLGILPPGAQLSSVRELSIELDINPNTVQKAYIELERQGLIHSVPGKGSFVTEDAGSQIRRLIAQEESERIRAAAGHLASVGFSEEIILEWIHDIFRNSKGENYHD